jgi:SPP1 gp7 family putative phage head morphogenesis protein
MGIALRHLVGAHPHGQRLRKRTRVLRGVKPSRKVELWYKAELLKIVAALRRETEAQLLPVLKQIIPALNKTGDGLARDAVVPRRPIDHSLTNLAQKFGGIDDTANRLASLAAQRSLEETDKRLAASIGESVKVDISAVLTESGPIRGAVTSAVRANVDLIKSIPQQYFDKVGSTVWDNLVDGVRFEDLAEKIQHIGDVTESRAKLIARDQTSKMNGAFNEARQTSLGIDRYIWSTSGDERVREDHAAQNGQIFDWASPPPTGHPGEDIQCRCVALPYVELDKEDSS